MSQNPNTLSGVVAEHIAAVNAFDEEAIVSHLRRRCARQRRTTGVLGDRCHPGLGGAGRWSVITSASRWSRSFDHHGHMVVRGRYDGDYDKTNLPEELILTNYFTVSEGKIDSLIVIRNTPV